MGANGTYFLPYGLSLGALGSGANQLSVIGGDMAMPYDRTTGFYPHRYSGSSRATGEGRPVTLERFHRGIGEKGFFQKNVEKGAPKWLERVAVPKSDGVVNYPVVRDTNGIMWLANQNCITPHAIFTAPHALPDSLPST